MILLSSRPGFHNCKECFLWKINPVENLEESCTSPSSSSSYSKSNLTFPTIFTFLKPSQVFIFRSVLTKSRNVVNRSTRNALEKEPLFIDWFNSICVMKIFFDIIRVYDLKPAFTKQFAIVFSSTKFPETARW